MSDQNTSADQAQNPNAPVFNMQRVYLKDLSLEMPHAPNIFLEQEGEAIPEISSTQVRELLGRALYKLVHEPIDYDEEAMGKDHDKLALMVGQEVADYIWTNNLYMGGKK